MGAIINSVSDTPNYTSNLKNNPILLFFQCFPRSEKCVEFHTFSHTYGILPCMISTRDTILQIPRDGDVQCTALRMHLDSLVFRNGYWGWPPIL